MNDVKIGSKRVGRDSPTYIVAELSGNHNGSLERAIETIRAVAKTGVDAVKLQTYTADTLTIDSTRPDFVVPGDGSWGGRTLHELYEEAHTPWEWHEALFETAHDAGIDIFSTPFDASAVELLEELGTPAYKIASFELPDDQLLKTVAGTGKPVILSTGMASLEEISHAVTVLREAGATDLVVLWCTSSYPAPDTAMNLSAIPELARVTGTVVGLSDHSMGTTAPVVAVTLGARFIEKHVTLRRADGGVDSHFSLEPAELGGLVEAVRRAEAMIGAPDFHRPAAEEASQVFRRSLYVVQDMAAGDTLTPDNLRSIRPGYGLSPRYYETLLGLKVRRDVERGTPFDWALLSEE